MEEKTEAPSKTSDVSEFPSVAPHIHSETYQYTLLVGEGAAEVQITSAARSVKELWNMLFPKAGASGAVVERAGNVAFFPEAVVRVEDVAGKPRVEVVAGWFGDDEGDEEIIPTDPDENEEETPRRRRKPSWSNKRD